MPLHVSSTRAHHQEVKIALHSLWDHYTYRCDDTRGCLMQFWPPDDEHICSKHVEARNELIVKQNLCASSWLITEVNRYQVFSTLHTKFCILVHYFYTVTNILTYSHFTRFKPQNYSITAIRCFLKTNKTPI